VLVLAVINKTGEMKHETENSDNTDRMENSSNYTWPLFSDLGVECKNYPPYTKKGITVTVSLRAIYCTISKVLFDWKNLFFCTFTFLPYFLHIEGIFSRTTIQETYGTPCSRSFLRQPLVN